MSFSKKLVVIFFLILIFPLVSRATDLRVGFLAGEKKHVVMLSYEPWFGKEAQHDWHRVPGTLNDAILPILRSPGLARHIDLVDDWGRRQSYDTDGYDSGDPKIISQHAEWIQALGVDAILMDMSNQVGDYQNINDRNAVSGTFRNIRAIYREYHEKNFNLKIVPMLGVYGSHDITSGGFERMLNDWYEMMTKDFPGHNIVYEGLPLMAVFHGAPQYGDTCGTRSCWQWTRKVLSETRPRGAPLGKNWFDYITVRHFGGYFDAQPSFWGENRAGVSQIQNNCDPAEIRGPFQDWCDPNVNFWSWIDRFQPKKKIFPTFTSPPYAKNTVEVFTAAQSSGGSESPSDFQAGNPDAVDTPLIRDNCYATRRGGISCGWGRPGKYSATAAKRIENGVPTFTRYMNVARELQPTFLIVNQWNQFEQVDEGFDYMTTHSIEPANYGPGIDPWEPYNLVKAEIKKYRDVIGSTTVTESGRLKSLALRGLTGVGEQILIGGFNASGTGKKRLIIQSAGPTLADFGVPNSLNQSAVTLFNGSGEEIAFNDSWPLDPQNNGDEIAALTGIRTSGREGALTRNLDPGGYSFHLGGSGGTLMNGYLALHEADQNKNLRLSNIAGRGYVGQSDDVLIAGLSVTGESRRVLIRGSGPSLAQFGVRGVLENPHIRLFRDQNEVKAVDDWQSEFNSSEISRKISGFGLDARDAAMVLTLEPGNYTVHLSGVGGSAGVGFVEVDDISE